MALSWDLVEDAPPTPDEWLNSTHAPWEMMPAENDQQFERFTLFREMGAGRSITQLATKLEMRPAYLYDLSTRFHWQHRAARWDYHLDEIYRREVVEHTKEMARRHAKVSEKALTALSLPLQTILAKDPEEITEALDAQDIMKLFRLIGDTVKTMPSIMAAERLAMGAPTDITRKEEQHRVQIDYGDQERLEETLRAVIGSNILDDALGARSSGPIIDAEIHEVHPDNPPPETDSLPAGTPD
jgi:hypothetical protein